MAITLKIHSETHPFANERTVEDIHISSTEYRRLLGYVGSDRPEGKEVVVANWAEKWYHEHSQPFFLSRRVAIAVNGIKKNRIFLATGEMLTSSVLAQRFHEGRVHEVIVFGISAGAELSEKVSQLWSEGHPDKAYFLDMYGAAATEQMARSLGLQWCQDAQKKKMSLLPHYSPGYDGWDLSDQVVLLNVLIDQPNTTGLSLTEAGMLQPVKSQLGVFGLTRSEKQSSTIHQYVPCESCSLEGCVYRRAAYQVKEIPLDKEVKATNLIAGTKKVSRYSFPEKALKRWSSERLTITTKDNQLHAQFELEGTTCGHMGKEIRFVYNVQLSSAAKDYRILEKTCRPQDGNTNYQAMCAYIKRGSAFLENIACHNALLGQPLAKALEWDPEVLPTGCQCTGAFQDHKWKIVLQTLHYQLHQLQLFT